MVRAWSVPRQARCVLRRLQSRPHNLPDHVKYQEATSARHPTGRNATRATASTARRRTRLLPRARASNECRCALVSAKATDGRAVWPQCAPSAAGGVQRDTSAIAGFSRAHSLRRPASIAARAVPHTIKRHERVASTCNGAADLGPARCACRHAQLHPAEAPGTAAPEVMRPGRRYGARHRRPGPPRIRDRRTRKRTHSRTGRHTVKRGRNPEADRSPS